MAHFEIPNLHGNFYKFSQQKWPSIKLNTTTRRKKNTNENKWKYTKTKIQKLASKNWLL